METRGRSDHHHNHHHHQHQNAQAIQLDHYGQVTPLPPPPPNPKWSFTSPTMLGKDRLEYKVLASADEFDNRKLYKANKQFVKLIYLVGPFLQGDSLLGAAKAFFQTRRQQAFTAITTPESAIMALNTLPKDPGQPRLRFPQNVNSYLLAFWLPQSLPLKGKKLSSQVN